MSNVLNFDVYKNTLKRRDGFSPVGGEYAYSKITCHFQEGDDWDGVHIVTAGFYVNAKHVVAVNAAIDNDNALTVSIPAQLLKKHEQIKFGLLGSVTADDEVVMTIATNVVSIDVARGIVSDALDEEAAKPGLYDRLIAALNEGLQNNIDYVNAQNAEQNTVIAAKADKTYVESQNAAQNEVIAAKADKTYVDEQNTAQNAVIERKANTDDVYSKTTAINLFERRIYKTDKLTKPELLTSDSYPNANAVINLVNSTRNDIEAIVSNKADKTYVDSQNAAQNSAIEGKADKSEIPDISGKAEKATTLAGYGITDAYTKDESDVKFFEFLDGTFAGDPNISPTLLVDNTIDTTYNPNGHYILYYIDSDFGRHNLFDFSNYFAEKAAVPSKTSQLTNDSGFLTSHQSLANYYNKTEVNSLLDGKANASHTHSQYLTSADIANKADKSEIPDISGKADKATTLAGYGITDAYTKDESDVKFFEFLDGTFAGDPNISPTLLVDNTIDTTYNPNGHYILYYIDSDFGRHNLFDFSNYFAEKAAVPSKTSQLTNDSGFLTSHQSLANYYNKTEVNSLLDGKANASHTHSQYLTSADIANKADKSEIPDISGKADKATTYTKSEVDALVSGGVVPQYVIDESESVLAKAFSHTGLGRTVRFIAVSDGHNDAAEVSHSYTRIANKHCGQAVKYIAERIPLDFVASLGDMTWAGVAHTTAQYQTDWLKADLQEMNLFLRDGFGGVPNIRVVGNHDQCATTGSGGAVSRLQNSGAYQLIGRYNAGTGDGLSNYGYYDIERAKLRVIYLNTSDTVSTSTQGTLLSVSQAQKNWLCETLIALNEKSDAADWKILLMSHAPLDMNSGIAADILLPYTNGGTYGSYAFTNHSAKIIGNCHGHTHCYNVGYMSDQIRRFTIPNANFYDNNHYKNNASYAAWNEDTTYPKTENSRTDTSFSLVTIDLDSEMCYVDNYGAGYDREFSLDYKSEPAPVNLFDKTDADVVIGGRFNSSRGITADLTETLVTGFIPATTADVLHVVTNKANNSNNQVGAAQLYDSGKNYIGIYISPKAAQNAGISPKPTWAADYLSGDFDLSVGTNSGTNAGVAYIRFCLAYTDIDKIVITKG